MSVCGSVDERLWLITSAVLNQLANSRLIAIISTKR